MEKYFDLLDLADESLYRELKSCSQQEVIERFRNQLAESVRRMMMSDVTWGIFLSGESKVA